MIAPRFNSAISAQAIARDEWPRGAKAAVDRTRVNREAGSAADGGTCPFAAVRLVVVDVRRRADDLFPHALGRARRCALVRRTADAVAVAARDCP